MTGSKLKYPSHRGPMCPVCNRKFKSLHGFKTHIGKKHPAEEKVKVDGDVVKARCEGCGSWVALTSHRPDRRIKESGVYCVDCKEVD